MAGEGLEREIIAFIQDNYGAEIIKLNSEGDDKDSLNLEPSKHGAIVALPKGMQIVDLAPYLEKLLERPKRIEASAQMYSADSMIDYLKRFAVDGTSLFLDPTGRVMRGIIDFHNDQDTPAFGKHNVTYTFPISEQFHAWTEGTKIPFDNAGMASFLQDRQYDIVNPPADWMQLGADDIARMQSMLNLVTDPGDVDDSAGESIDPAGDDTYIPRSALYKLRKIRFANAARLVQIARTVEISINSEVKSAYDPQTGAKTLHFSENSGVKASSDGRKVSLPEMFLINVPLFVGAAPQTMPIRLIYRVVSGNVKWMFVPVEWQRLLREAVMSEAKRVSMEASIPLFIGVHHR